MNESKHKAGRAWRAARAALLAAACWPMLALAQADSGSWDMRVCADPNNLPYTNQAEQGFENRIAEILADELDARLSYVWFPRRRLFVDQMLRSGNCDMIMGVADGSSKVLTTLPYYRSSFVFVYPENAPFEVTSFDDEVLKDLSIGVQLTGEGGGSPPNVALAHRHLAANLEGYPVIIDYQGDKPLAPIIDAVANGDVDIAVAWGPIAGYFAKQEKIPLRVVPVSPEFEPPSLPMVFSMAIGLRLGDRDFEYLLDRALVKRWDEIQGVLQDFGVPLLPLTKPLLTLPSEGGDSGG